MVCLVLEREEGAADVECGGCPGRVEDKFSDWVTLLRCRRSGGQALKESLESVTVGSLHACRYLANDVDTYSATGAGTKQKTQLTLREL